MAEYGTFEGKKKKAIWGHSGQRGERMRRGQRNRERLII